MKPPLIEHVFLSCASAEFAPLRLRLANYLRALIAPRFEVIVQEDLQQGGHTLLERIAESIQGCDLVIHIAGDICGARPTPGHVAALYQRLGEPLPDPVPDYSYTQWEYQLARKFDKRMLVYLADSRVPRRGPDSAPPAQSDEDASRQQVHVQQIRHCGKHRAWFGSTNQLLQQVLHDINPDGPPPRKASNLDVKSLGSMFKGRDKFLDEIHVALGEVEHRGVVRAAAITATATAATVYGLGGIGKTRAAIEYAHHHADDYTALLLVRADTPEKLSANLAELCVPAVLDLPEYQNPDADVRFAAALRWLLRHPGWFLILDNVDTEAAATEVEHLLARLDDAGQVLITSRISNWSAAVSTLPLDVLTLDDSVVFLMERTENRRLKRPDDAAQARILAAKLGQLPLALEQAGAQIGKEHLSFEKYLAQWAANSAKVMQWYDERLMQYPVSVAVTWLTTFEQLGAAARKLLRTLAWFAPNPIPGSVFDDSATLGELAAYSLLTWNDEGGFSVHRLVQEVTRARMNVDERRDALMDAVVRVNQAFQGEPDETSSWPGMEALASHGQALVLETMEPDNGVGSSASGFEEEQAALGLRLGRFFHATGRFMQAYRMQSRSVQLYRRMLGEEDPATLTAMNTLTSTLLAQGDLHGARSLGEKVLEVRRRVLGEEHPGTLTAMNNLATTLQEQGDFPGARAFHEAVLRGLRRVLGEDHPGTLTSMANLASTLLELGDLPGARALEEKVLEVRRRVLGEEHPDTLTSMNNLASTLWAQGDLTEARGVQEKVLEAVRRMLGDEHPNTLTSMANLAMMCAQGNLPGARALEEKVLEARRRLLGEKHPDTLLATSNLASTLFAQGDLTGARALEERLIEVRRGLLGEEHPDTLASMHNLAETLRAQGDLPGARGLQEEALEVWRRVLGEEHPDTLTAMNNLAATLREQGDLPDACGLQQKVLEGRQRVLGAKHPDTLMSMSNLAVTLRAQGDLVGALRMLEKLKDALTTP